RPHPRPPPPPTLFPYTTLFRSQPAKMEMVATDGHRMALINFPQGNGQKKGTDLTILIPRKALEEILRLEGGEDGTVHFGVSENRSEEHTSELQSLRHLVCRLLL